MRLFVLRFCTLLLAALALTMESAHLLELPQKMSYNAQMYAAVNSTLYRYFAIVGGFYEVGSIILAFALAYAVRRRPVVSTLTWLGAAFLGLSFLAWLTVVQQVNSEVAQGMERAPDLVPSLWMSLRNRWEYGHVLGFILNLAGLAALILSVLAEVPRGRPAPLPGVRVRSAGP